MTIHERTSRHLEHEHPEGSGAVSGAVSGACDDDAIPRTAQPVPAGQPGGDPGSDSPRNQRVPGAPGRSRSADQRRMAIIRRLTDRDREIVRSVDRHRVLTTEQLAQAFFPTKRRAWARLGDLVRLELLVTFRPFAPNYGTSQLHFVLGRTGAALLAAEDEDHPSADPIKAALRWRYDRVTAIAFKRSLPHLLGVNAVWAALAGHARCHPRDAELVAWLTEREAGNWTGGIVRPDALLEWQEHGISVEAFLEYDRGTERLAVLADKLRSYERLEEESGSSSWVLFAFASPGREASARAALAHTTVPVATAVLNGDARPHDAVWLPLSHAHERVRLSALDDVPKPSRALHRAASGSPRAWRFARSAHDEEAPIDS